MLWRWRSTCNAVKWLLLLQGVYLGLHSLPRSMCRRSGTVHKTSSPHHNLFSVSQSGKPPSSFFCKNRSEKHIQYQPWSEQENNSRKGWNTSHKDQDISTMERHRQTRQRKREREGGKERRIIEKCNKWVATSLIHKLGLYQNTNQYLFPVKPSDFCFSTFHKIPLTHSWDDHLSLTIEYFWRCLGTKGINKHLSVLWGLSLSLEFRVKENLVGGTFFIKLHGFSFIVTKSKTNSNSSWHGFTCSPVWNITIEKRWSSMLQGMSVSL